jgi:hypothetical protein
MKTYTQFINELSEGNTTKRQSGKAFWDRMRMQPTRELEKFSDKSKRKFADRIRAHNAEKEQNNPN